MKIKELQETVRFKNLRVRTLTGQEGWFVKQIATPDGATKVVLIPDRGSNKTVEVPYATAEELLNEIFEWEVLDYMKKTDICEVCQEHISVGIVASKLAPISYGICSKCTGVGAEPMYIIINIIETLGWDLNKLDKWAKDSLIFYHKESKTYVDAKKADIKFLKTLSSHPSDE